MKKPIYSLLLSMLLLSGCITTPSLAPEQRPPEWGKMIEEQHNFYQIDTDVFRSEQPDQALKSLLTQYQIGTVINLRSRHDDPQFLDANEFELVHLPIHTWAINRQDMLDVMQHIQHAKQQQQKVLLHCYHGSDRTGASVAMYRIIFQHWPIENAVKEMKYGGYGFHPVWFNIEKLFSPENISWIRAQLADPTQQNP